MDADFGFIPTPSLTSCMILDNSLNIIRLLISYMSKVRTEEEALQHPFFIPKFYDIERICMNLTEYYVEDHSYCDSVIESN